MLVKSLIKGGIVINDFIFWLSYIELLDWYSVGVCVCM